MKRVLWLIVLIGCSSGSGTIVITPPKQGSIALSETPTRTQASGFAEVYFSTYDGPQRTCTQRAVGSCFLESCSSFDGGSLMRTGVAVGTVTVTGVQLVAPLTANAQGLYFGSIQSAWTPGQTLSVSATGGNGIPAFAYSTKAPATVTVSPSGNVTAQRSNGLSISWTSDVPGSLTIFVLPSGGASPGVYAARCTAQSGSTSGQLTVPGEVLSAFTGASTVKVSGASTNETDATLGDWPVAMIASSSAIDATGVTWSLTASLM